VSVTTGVQVTTEYGVIEGALHDDLALFRGVPFAAPPFGSRRFLPPQSPEKWEGVRQATVRGVGAYQPDVSHMEGMEIDALSNPEVQGDDCLTLEIWTPKPGSGPHPVMVWIHGGGYMFGSGSAPAYSGKTFARDGIVHVGINYRLGLDGFIYLGEGRDNLGLRDQVAALEWVQRNIAAFGGDPANVTIFGQSGGAVSVMNLLAMPSAKGLFVRAIAESGNPGSAVTPAEATKWTKRFAKRLGVAPTAEGFASVPIEKSTAEETPFILDFINPLKHGSTAFWISPFRAVLGTPTLPENLVTTPNLHGVPLITGTTRNETIGFLKTLGRMDGINPFIGWFFRRAMGVTSAIRRAYRTGPRQITNTFAEVEAVWTDWGFRMPTIDLVEKRSDPTWLYEFHWESPQFPAGLGSAHALETPFVRDDFATILDAGKMGEDLLGLTPPQSLANSIHSAWVAFAKTGDPGWPKYDTTERKTMVFNTTSEVVNDPASPEREAWAAKR
jgi:para-nitrobenzyl esterase